VHDEMKIVTYHFDKRNSILMGTQNIQISKHGVPAAFFFAEIAENEQRRKHE